jgi:addiction module RelB/DinJ family antitoxin
MAKTNTIHMRVEPEVKVSAESILNRLGMTTAEAITVFLNQIILNGGLPFAVRMPSNDNAFLSDRLVGLIPADVDEKALKRARLAAQ